ncbi:MAG: FecR domain-containing protein [Arachidicoccus sp.]|nr:FecR domain-containing protein [Arachidicoccus sp.]
MEENEIRILLDKYFSGICTEEEISELNTWYERLGKGSYKPVPNKVYTYQEEYIDERFKMLSQIIDQQSSGFKKRSFLRIAAILFLFIGTGIFMYLHYRSEYKSLIAINQKIGVPGSNGAVLTLSNGRQIVLDSVNGSVAVQGNKQVVNDSGKLSYHPGNIENTEVVYNTLSTPRGRQYTLILPDGTKAMLNAASSIKYPTAFTENKREVEVSGEVYFEVVHNTSMPFTVKSGNIIIHDIGTHFDIINYPDESFVKTTLLEGAVAVEANSISKQLQPGDQAVITNNNEFKIKQLPDVEDVIAWTKGIIDFNSVDIATLLQQLSRWYNVDIVYKTDVPQGSISGGIPRNTELPVIIKALNADGIHCNLSGSQLIVTQ